jgi:hypothetical protein
MRRRGWGLGLAVLAALGALAVVGRLLDLPQDRRSPAAATPVVSVATPPPMGIPESLRRPVRLPNLGRDGSCPASPAVGPPMTRARPVAAVAVGDGPVYPVLFRAAPDGRLDRSAVAYWDAPEPPGGVVIVRGHRLGAPEDRVRFLSDSQQLSLVHVLDPAVAHPAGPRGHWWRPTRLRVGAGCYGLQIDGPDFSEVLVVEFK